MKTLLKMIFACCTMARVRECLILIGCTIDGLREVFMSGGQMEKTKYKNEFNTETGQAMHREVRSSLTSVSDLSLSVNKSKT
jgi:hypothetical protein